MMIVSLMVMITLVSANMEYNRELSIQLYRYSQIAFCNDEKILRWNCDWPCRDNPRLIDIQIVQSDLLAIRGYVGFQESTNRIVVAFRGSDDWKNWALDFDALKTHDKICAECKVHTGFHLAWVSIQHDVALSVKLLSIKYPAAKLYITGHSMGAAIATLAAIHIQQDGMPVESLYTFGCPRVGNKAFALHVQSSMKTAYRVVHNLDLIPQLPQQLLGYHHYAQEVWLKEDLDDFTICSGDNGEDKNCQNSVPFNSLERSQHAYYFGLYIDCEGHE